MRHSAHGKRRAAARPRHGVRRDAAAAAGGGGVDRGYCYFRSFSQLLQPGVSMRLRGDVGRARPALQHPQHSGTALSGVPAAVCRPGGGVGHDGSAADGVVLSCGAVELCTAAGAGIGRVPHRGAFANRRTRTVDRVLEQVSVVLSAFSGDTEITSNGFSGFTLRVVCHDARLGRVAGQWRRRAASSTSFRSLTGHLVGEEVRCRK